MLEAHGDFLVDIELPKEINAMGRKAKRAGDGLAVMASQELGRSSEFQQKGSAVIGVSVVAVLCYCD